MRSFVAAVSPVILFTGLLLIGVFVGAGSAQDGDDASAGEQAGGLVIRAGDASMRIDEKTPASACPAAEYGF